ncbi:MAG: hypothetical protein EBZ16_05025 [Flavobacteriia bacterium]|nr:hypothetical protein [Flavobacteriia bacterium]
MSQDSSAKRQRNIIFLLIALVAALAFFALNQTNQVNDLEEEKAALITQLEDYKRDLAAQTSANDSLNAYIAQETARLNAMIEKVERINAASASQLKSMRGEVFSLRKKIARLTEQVDSVNEAYAALVVVKDSLTTDLTEEVEKNEVLTTTNTQLSGEVEKASKLQLSSIEASAYRVSGKGVEKATTSAGKSNRMKACMTIAKNLVAKKGEYTLYLRINTPDGRVLAADGKDRTMVVGSETIFQAPTPWMSTRPRKKLARPVWPSTKPKTCAYSA